MRGASGLQILVFVVTSVACDRNAPLPGHNTGTGTGGKHPTTGSAGHGGSMSGAAGGTQTGVAGTAGVVGAAGTGGTAAGGFGGTVNTCTTNSATVTTSPCKCIQGAFVHMGACACQPATPDICPTVGCVDKMHDPTNCGACAIACPATSTCNAGTCGPVPTMVSPAIAGCNLGMTMAVPAAGGLYFADAANGTINELGNSTPLATGEMGATMLQANGANLFWYSTGSKKIRSISAAGGTPATVYTNSAMAVDGGMPPDVAGFVVTPDGVNIYISLGNQVLEAPLAGVSSTVVVNNVDSAPGALALNGTTSIVFPACCGVAVIESALLSAMPATCGPVPMVDMTTCTRVAIAHDVLPGFVAVIAGNAYWISEFKVLGAVIGAMSGSFSDIADAQTSQIAAAAATADAIYFADADPTDPTHGYIEKTSLAPSSTATPLARGQSSPIAIAVDATKVYWATSDCAIWSLNR
jgi:hypothetical protein